jgi:hypothetical protein
MKEEEYLSELQCIHQFDTKSHTSFMVVGVSKIDARVEEKIVIVTAEGVTGEQLVEKLSKWSAASGKYVRLAA